MALTPQWLDELRTRVTLSAVIMRTTKLTRAGREWKACCPFHNEKSPSFTVNDEKGFYHCFGCGAHGDAIRWMTDQRGLEFMDAVKELAAEAGLEVPAPDPRFAQKAKQRDTLHDVMSAAQDWFVHTLSAPEGEKARAYLQTRGFDPLTISRFGFGYAPDSRTALARALENFEPAQLIETGLRISVEERDPYDRFRDRLMLPIHDARGRVIAFGGRILTSGKTDAPKYLNSPETPLFDKGRTLYNLHRAGPAARRSGRIIAVEGYMDVIALAAAGFEEAVAPMGTALTEHQIELMWRVADKPILCFDGDAAGQRAAMRSIERTLPLLRAGRSINFVKLPTGLDPDDLIRQQGKAAFEALLNEPISLIDMLWTGEKEAQPLNSPEDKAGLKQRLIDRCDQISDGDIKSLYRRELLDRYSDFAFPKRAAWQGNGPRQNGQNGGNFGGNKGGKWQPPVAGASDALRRSIATPNASRDQLAQTVLYALTLYPDQISRHAEALVSLAASQHQLAETVDLLLESAAALEDGAELTISANAVLVSPPDNARFAFLLEGSDPLGAREELAEAVSLLVERPALDAAIAEATARFEIDPEAAFVEQQRLRKRKLEIETRLGQMARKRAAIAAVQDQASSAPAPGTDGQKTD